MVSLRSVRSGTGPLIDKAAMEASLRKNMRIYGQLLIQELQQQYKDIPEGKYYKRRYPRGRGGVGGGWHMTMDSDGNGVTVYNDVPYARFVQGHRGQQSHFNREVGWRSIDEIAARTRKQFNSLMRESLVEGVAKARRERNRKGQFV